MLLPSTFITVLLCFLTFSCTERREKVTQEELQDIQQLPELESKDTPIEVTEDQDILKEIENIGVVGELTPEIFVKITILHNREYQTWLEKSQILPTDDQSLYLDEMNRIFFSQFGLSESEYVTYSQDNMEELNNYIESHPELLVQLQEH